MLARSQCHTIGMKLTEKGPSAGLLNLHADAGIMRFGLGIGKSEGYVSYDGRIMRCLNSVFHKSIYRNTIIYAEDLEY